ncbi:hypothetical protein [Parasphingorhabdus pacifica]
MAHTAHVLSAGKDQGPVIVVRDDRGATVTELQLPANEEATAADDELRAAGWERSADWSTASDGWLAPVVTSAD